MKKTRILFVFFVAAFITPRTDIRAQEARVRWEMLNLIRNEKFDLVLPKVMRENAIDMWIVVVKRGHKDPLHVDLGGGSPDDWWSRGNFLGYYIFTDRGGDRIERTVLGIHGYTLRYCGAYDIFGSAKDLKKFVEERDPMRIGINMSKYIGAADGLSHTCFMHLVETLGGEYAKRLVSAEKLVAGFRSQRVTSEIVAFGKAAELTRQIMERALSNEVITPGVTTRDEVGWWIQDQLLAMGLLPQASLPGVIYPVEGRSKDYIIQRGHLLSLDWGIEMLNFTCDIKRAAYVLREGETAPPPSIQDAYNQGLKVRKIIRKHVKPGITGEEMLELLYRKTEEAGFQRQEVEDEVTTSNKTEVNIGWHSVGNLGHGVGPAIWFEKPLRYKMKIRPTQLYAFEFFVYVPLPEWEGKKLRLGIEDDVVITENGVEWLYPMTERILLIH
ncbi:MAG: aminopeptidase P family protein [Candidatus Aminicenantes bacterium]|nr:MAG: aminopeptidase P family protein [Candidatus Aminicenantes bacterium]